MSTEYKVLSKEGMRREQRTAGEMLRLVEVGVVEFLVGEGINQHDVHVVQEADGFRQGEACAFGFVVFEVDGVVFCTDEIGFGDVGFQENRARQICSGKIGFGEVGFGKVDFAGIAIFQLQLFEFQP